METGAEKSERQEQEVPKGLRYDTGSRKGSPIQLHGLPKIDASPWNIRCQA